MDIMITAFYTGLAGLLMVALALGVVKARVGKRVSLGDGGEQVVLVAIRKFGNYIEYVPYYIIIMAVMELQSIDTLYIHILGVNLILARLLHIMGLKPVKKVSSPRVIGTSLTLLGILAGSITLIMSTADKIF